jgi:hypothetical protein
MTRSVPLEQEPTRLETIIRQFSEWQKSPEAKFEIQGHSIKWNFSKSIKEIIYKDSQVNQFKLTFGKNDEPIKISFLKPRLSNYEEHPVTESTRIKILSTVSQIIESISLRTAKSDEMKKLTKLIDNYHIESDFSLPPKGSSISSPARGSSKSIDLQKIKLITDTINKSEHLIDPDTRKFELIDNAKFKINIGINSNDFKTIVYIDKENNQTYVGQIKNDELIFYKGKPKPSGDNKIVKSEEIDEIISLFSSAITAISSRSYHQSESSDERPAAGRRSPPPSPALTRDPSGQNRFPSPGRY